MARGGAVLCRGELRRDEQGDDAAVRGQLRGPLDERDREVGPMPERRAYTTPPAIPARQPAPGRARDVLRPEPGRVPDDQVEASRREHVGEVALVVEPRQLAIGGDRPAGLPDGPALGAELGDVLAQFAIEAATVTEEVHAPRRLQAFTDAPGGVLFGVAQR